MNEQSLIVQDRIQSIEKQISQPPQLTTSLSNKNFNISQPLIKERQVIEPIKDFKQIWEKYKIEKNRSTSKGMRQEEPQNSWSDEKNMNIIRSSTIKLETGQNFNLNPFDPSKSKNPFTSIKSSMFESAIWQS